jgi:hypothetical protein
MHFLKCNGTKILRNLSETVYVREQKNMKNVEKIICSAFTIEVCNKLVENVSHICVLLLRFIHL